MTNTEYSLAETEQWRQDKDAEFRHPSTSPLTADQRDRFDGLRYFPIDPALCFIIEAEVFPDDEQTMQRIMTTANEIRHYVRYARLSFSVATAVGDQSGSLVLYLDQDGENFFLPFMDTTNGAETYAAGRYVEIERLGGGVVRVDFNRAYNPYCAYNAGWNCPYVPTDNRLDLPIRAGEMRPPDMA